MPLIDDLNVSVLNGELKHRYAILDHELCGYGTAYKMRECLSAVLKVLVGLNRRVFVIAPFCLNRHNELTTVSIYPNVNLVNFDLTNAGYRCSKVVLKRVNRNS